MIQFQENAQTGRTKGQMEGRTEGQTDPIL